MSMSRLHPTDWYFEHRNKIKEMAEINVMPPSLEGRSRYFALEEFLNECRWEAVDTLRRYYRSEDYDDDIALEVAEQEVQKLDAVIEKYMEEPEFLAWMERNEL